MPLAVLVAGELVSGRRPQPPAPSVALNPIRTRWMEHLGRRPPCLRIMPFRTSCGRPDPAAVAGLRDHDQVFPALSARPRSRWSRWQATGMASISQPNTTARGPAIDSGSIPSREILLRPVAVSPIRTRSLERLEKPTACPRTTRCPLLCASHDKREDVVRRQR